MWGVIVLSLCSCDFDIIIFFNKIRFGSVWIYLIFLSAKRTWEGKKQNIEEMNNSMSQPTQQIILKHSCRTPDSLPCSNTLPCLLCWIPLQSHGIIGLGGAMNKVK